MAQRLRCFIKIYGHILDHSYTLSTLGQIMQSNKTTNCSLKNLSDTDPTKKDDYKLNKGRFVALYCTDLSFIDSTPCSSSIRGIKSSHFVCVAQQQGCVLSVGGVAAHIDYCGKAQLLPAARRCVTSRLQLPKTLIFLYL